MHPDIGQLDLAHCNASFPAVLACPAPGMQRRFCVSLKLKHTYKTHKHPDQAPTPTHTHTLSLSLPFCLPFCLSVCRSANLFPFLLVPVLVCNTSLTFLHSSIPSLVLSAHTCFEDTLQRTESPVPTVPARLGARAAGFAAVLAPPLLKGRSQFKR